MPCAKELKRYASKMVQFMSWRDDFSYPKNHVFTDAQRDSVKPDEILSYMTLVAYGKVDVDEDNRPTLARANALKTIKRSISYFMRRKSKWEPIDKRGNLTRHHTINNFLKQVEQFQCQGEKVAPQACRAFTYGKFQQLLQLAETRREEVAIWFRAVLLTQWQMIGRINEIQRIQAMDFRI